MSAPPVDPPSTPPGRPRPRRFPLFDGQGRETSLHQLLPSTFVIDREGIVRYRYIGASVGDRPDARAVLEAVRQIAGAANP